MLVLSRKIRQSIVVGDGVEIVVLGVRGRVVRLGIAAPRTVRVVRGELADRGQAAPHGASDCDNVPPAQSTRAGE